LSVQFYRQIDAPLTRLHWPQMCLKRFVSAQCMYILMFRVIIGFLYSIIVIVDESNMIR